MCESKRCGGAKGNRSFKSLAEYFPDIAKQAHGWDPRKVSYGAGIELEWKCEKGHIFKKTPNARTGTIRRGCEYCAGKKVLAGFNCLKSKFPEIAREAHGWDPSTVTHGCGEWREWKCPLGHIYSAQISTRTNMGSGCSYCSGKKVLPGFNCLKSRFPKIAREAHGWDPKKYTFGSNADLDWKCSKCRNIFTNTIKARTVLGRGCRVCTHQQVVPGVNDLKTLFPSLAKEAHGWDPLKIFPCETRLRNWKCKLGHIFSKKPVDRVACVKKYGASKCSYCSNQKVLKGYNDMKTTRPDLAKILVGTDPESIVAGTNKELRWRCEKCNGIYKCSGNKKIYENEGCPDCCDFGFNRKKPGILYLIGRSSQLKVGIMNVGTSRLRNHKRRGWSLIETVEANGEIVAKLERDILRKLRAKKVPTGKAAFPGQKPFDGYTEAWRIIHLEAKSIRGLCRKLGIDLDAFLAA